MGISSIAQEGVRSRGQVEAGAVLGRFNLSVATLVATTMLLPAAAWGQAERQSEQVANKATAYGNLPLSFEANEGQTAAEVEYLSRGSGYSVYLTENAAVMALSKRHTDDKRGVPGAGAVETDAVRMELVRAQRAHGFGTDELPGKVNYFVGNDPARWRTGLPTFAKVKYTSVYPGIDLVYYGNQRQLEYDFVVGAGADVRAVRLRFAGAQKLAINAAGDLEVKAAHGTLDFHKPLVYQMRDGKREPVGGRFQLLAKQEVGFAIGSYDHSRQLVVDPTLSYSTYLGGNGTYAGDTGSAIAVDAEGHAYVTGSTGSTNFPTLNPYQKSLSGPGGNVTILNAFVSKLNETGTALVYSTYLGGNDNYRFGDAGRGIAVDATGAAYVTGTTGSTTFPITSDAYQKTNHAAIESGSFTGFVTKLSPAGNTLVYSTFLGGSGVADCCNVPYGDSAQAIALGAEGHAYIAGYTSSKDYPVMNAYQKQNRSKVLDYYGQKAGYNAFVTELNSSGSGLVYSTYLGGTGDDAAFGIALDGQGSAYLVGTAGSFDFPVSSDAFQKTNRSTSTYSTLNVFVSKLGPGGGTLEYSTYLGGSNAFTEGDHGTAIAVDPECYAYVTGWTPSSNFPTTKGSLEPTSQATLYSYSAFVTKLNTTGSGLVYSTFLGGSNIQSGSGDFGYGIQVDAAGQAYVTGIAKSADFPVTTNAYQSKNGEAVNGPAGYYSGNAFLTEFNAEGSGLVYSSYLGGSGSATGNGGDTANGIALDNAGNAYLIGTTYSQNFPVAPDPGAFQTANKGGTTTNHYTSNAFVSKFGIGTGDVLSATTVTISADANPAAADVKTTFTAFVQQETTCGFPPSGIVTFVVDKGAPIKVSVDATGRATYSTSTLALGKHTVTASYSGDVKYSPSTSSTYTETITGAPTSLAALSGSGQSAMYGAVFSKPLTVLVKDAAGAAAPGVVVNFAGTGLKFSSTTALTNESGEASVTVTAAAVGNLTATATVTGVTGSATFTLSGTKAVLTVKATNVSVPYGSAIPKLSYTVAGYVNGDTSTVVTGVPGESTTAKQGSPVGTYPITLTLGTLKATNYTFSLVNGTLTITSLGTAKAPTFSPVGGSYTSAQSVTLASATSGATIYYTTNGTTPTTSSTKYSKAISVTTTETIKAIAAAPGYATSGVSSAMYTIE
jgi:hypothetical protein